jgi:acyl carrier protein
MLPAGNDRRSPQEKERGSGRRRELHRPNRPKEHDVASKEEIHQRVVEIISAQVNVPKEQLKPETSFAADLHADSLDIVEIVMELEDEFDITIPDDAAEKITTVGQAVEYIHGLAQ